MPESDVHKPRGALLLRRDGERSRGVENGVLRRQLRRHLRPHLHHLQLHGLCGVNKQRLAIVGSYHDGRRIAHHGDASAWHGEVGGELRRRDGIAREEHASARRHGHYVGHSAAGKAVPERNGSHARREISQIVNYCRILWELRRWRLGRWTIVVIVIPLLTTNTRNTNKFIVMSKSEKRGAECNNLILNDL